MEQFISLFNIYKPNGIIKAVWVILRVLILPFKRLDDLILKKGRIIDIGCGNGGFANYISLTSPERFVLGLDLSKVRINDAITTLPEPRSLKAGGEDEEYLQSSAGFQSRKTVNTRYSRKNIDFQLADILSMRLPKAECYLLIDVLHHISFNNQIDILSKLADKLDGSCQLVIKEVDKANIPAFLFGHLFEKILYPKEKIYARTKSDWIKNFKNLGLSYKIYPGALYFPDSTVIFICQKK